MRRPSSINSRLSNTTTTNQLTDNSKTHQPTTQGLKWPKNSSSSHLDSWSTTDGQSQGSWEQERLEQSTYAAACRDWTQHSKQNHSMPILPSWPWRLVFFTLILNKNNFFIFRRKFCSNSTTYRMGTTSPNATTLGATLNWTTKDGHAHSTISCK